MTTIQLLQLNKECCTVDGAVIRTQSILNNLPPYKLVDSANAREDLVVFSVHFATVLEAIVSQDAAIYENVIRFSSIEKDLYYGWWSWRKGEAFIPDSTGEMLKVYNELNVLYDGLVAAIPVDPPTTSNYILSNGSDYVLSDGSPYILSV